ncbi:hypothetical protein [Thalassobellus citreus]|uniref:hypothetical protein n=1 Tax=Thalassobellus citreus TaxID=3367752 RepID=UPI003790FAA4
MKIKIEKGSLIMHLVVFLILVGILSFGIGKVNIYTIVFPLLFTLINIYFEEVYYHKVTSKRRKKIYELISEKYGNGKITENEHFKSLIENRNILFYYHSSIYRFRINNFLSIYIDISDLNENIKQFCRIHFHCKKLEDRDYICSNVSYSLFSNSLKTLTKNSEKSIKDIIKKSEKYIAEKEQQIQ